MQNSVFPPRLVIISAKKSLSLFHRPRGRESMTMLQLQVSKPTGIDSDEDEVAADVPDIQPTNALQGPLRPATCWSCASYNEGEWINADHGDTIRVTPAKPTAPNVAGPPLTSDHHFSQQSANKPLPRVHGLCHRENGLQRHFLCVAVATAQERFRKGLTRQRPGRPVRPSPPNGG